MTDLDVSPATRIRVTQAALEQVIRDAGAIGMKFFHDRKNVAVNKKAARDFVTEADVAIEAFLKEKLIKDYPEYGFWGEETGQTADQTNRWIVDPIDGTHSFSKGQYGWSVSIALEIEGELMLGAVYAPVFDDLYIAEKGKGAFKNGERIFVSDETELADAMIATGFACLRSYLTENNLERFSRIAQYTAGQRRFGSAALDLCLVADGQVDAFWEQELNLYDVAAGALIALEAGGTLTDFNGIPGIFPKQILATNGKVLEQILPLM